MFPSNIVFSFADLSTNGPSILFPQVLFIYGTFLGLRGVHFNKYSSFIQTLHGLAFWTRVIEIKL